MKSVIWTFVTGIEPASRFDRTVVTAVLDCLGESMRSPSGSYEFYSRDGDQISFRTKAELEERLASIGGGSIKVWLPPEQWDFTIDFDPEGNDSRIVSESNIKGGERLPEIAVTTNMIWTKATPEQAEFWNKSFLVLAECVIKAAKPLWGVRLHEWDYEHILPTNPDLFEYQDELRQGHLPRLLGPVTYLSDQLISSAPLNQVKELQVGPWVNALGSFISMPEGKWEATLQAWSEEIQKKYSG